MSCVQVKMVNECISMQKCTLATRRCVSFVQTKSNSRIDKVLSNVTPVLPFHGHAESEKMMLHVNSYTSYPFFQKET